MAKKNFNKKPSVVNPNEVTEQDFKDMNEKLGLNNIKVKQRPKLIISNECHSHIRALHCYSPHTEWLALCKIISLWEWTFKLVDMIHPEQTTSAGDCEPTDKGLDWAVDYLIEQKEKLWEWNCILHSHHWMSCFWSGTDDKARLGYNDWRFMCWAVVTAYSWEPEVWEISYKGCVNFYKPYNIEIDADIEIEWEDYYKQCKEFGESDSKRNDKIKELAKSIFEESIDENAIEEMDTKPDYSKLLGYLWIDISEELEENYKEVQKKMPNKKLEEYYSSLYKEACDKAEEIIWEEPAVISDEALQWKEWSDELVEQLKNNKVAKTYWFQWQKDSKTTSTQTSLFPSASKYDYTYDEYTIDDNWYFYNVWNYPTKEILKEKLGIPPKIWLYDNKDWTWIAYNPVKKTREPVDDCLDDLFEYEL